MHLTGQIFAQDSAVVKTQILFSYHGCFKTYAINNHRETIKSNKHTMIKQREGFFLFIYSQSGPSQRQASCTNTPIKGLRQDCH